MQKKRNLNFIYRSRYIILFCALAVISFMSATHWAHIKAVDDIIKANLVTMRELSAHDQQLIRNEIATHIINLKNVSKKIRGKKPKTAEQISNLLASELDYFGGSDVIALVASDGTIIRSNSLISKNPDLLDTCKKQYGDFFLRHEQKGKDSSDSKKSSSPQQRVITQKGNFFSRYDHWEEKTAEYRYESLLIGTKARNLYLGDLKFEYIVDICLVENIYSKINVSSYNGKGVSTLIDGNGDFIINIDKKGTLLSRDNFFAALNINSLPGFSSIEEFKDKIATLAEPFSMEIEKDGKKFVVLFSPFVENTWTYITMVPREIFEEQSIILYKKYLTFLVPIIILLIIIAFILFQLKEKSRKMAIERLIAEEHKKNLDILSILSSEYTAIYYVNLKTGILTPYITGEKNQDNEQNTPLIGTNFSESFTEYINTYVDEKDRESLFKFNTPEKLSSALANKKNISVAYKKVSEGLKHFYEMKIVKTGEDDKVPDEIVLAFTDRDFEIAMRFITDQFREEYTAIFMVDIITNTYRIFKVPDEIRHVHELSDGTWTGMGKLFLQECSEKTRNAIAPVYDLPQLQKELQVVKRREYLYQLKVDKNLWRRAVVQSVEKENGVPTIILFRVSMLDTYAAENENLNRKVLEQQKELQTALDLAQSANKAKTTFLNNMSHDIRTPMNAIIGFTDMAVKYIQVPGRVLEYLEKIGIASRHLLSLINDILEMSRIESGKITLNEDEEDLDILMQNLKNMVQVDIVKKQQNLTIDTAGVYDKKVICDKLRINQILLNLISNATKYTAPNGTINVRLTELQHEQDGFALFEFRVKDNGIGMSPEFIKIIFDPFTRVNSSTVSGIQGTGLGMTITKNIVKMMNGTIEATSKEGSGSEFIVSIPLKLSKNKDLGNAPVPSKEVSLLTREKFNFSGLKILLVEDNELNREIAQDLLEEEGILVDTAEDGLIALEKVQSSKPGQYDLILMDIQMPNMDGYEATKRIRKLPDQKLASLPIFAMTANAFIEDKTLAMKAGMNDHIAKPIERSVLFKSIENYFTNKKTQ